MSLLAAGSWLVVGTTAAADLPRTTGAWSSKLPDGRGECSEKRSAAPKLDMRRDIPLCSGASCAKLVEPLGGVAFRDELTE
jgi:hypothetical protein